MTGDSKDAFTYVATEVASIKARVDTIYYALKFLVSEQDWEKVKSIEKFNRITEFVQLFEESPNYQNNEEYHRLLKELKELDKDLTAKGILNPQDTE